MKWEKVGNIAGKKGTDGKDGNDARAPDATEIAAFVLKQIPAPRDGVDGKNGAGISHVLQAPGEKCFTLVLEDGSSSVIDLPKGERGEKGENGRAPNREEIFECARHILPELIERAIDAAVPSIVAKAAILVPHGRDGRDGKDANTGLIVGEVLRSLPDPIDGKDGRDGINGKDGASLDDFTAELKDGRTLVLSLKLSDGEIQRREIVLRGMVVDAGVYRSGATYVHGDAVTYAGSCWIAQTDTKAAPGNGSADWRLAVKRGRDGKDLVGELEHAE